ncbi:MAG: hypothetical protein Q8J74_06960, partial [Candidatus Didemnitutus sp.]|nr:hypothetical protein [Candidatus Didemnitutus sp.]
ARRGTIVSIELAAEVVEAGGFVSQNVRLVADTGLQVELRVLRPAGGEELLPVVVLLGGHRTGRDAVKLLGSPGGIAVAALNYPYQGPERPRGFWQTLGVVGPARRALRETPSAVLLAAEWLSRQSWVDPARMEIAGVSLGVPFAAVAGALEPRFRRVWLIQGGADLGAWIEHNLVVRLPNATVRRVTTRLIYRLARGSLFEPGYWAPRISPRSIVLIGARDDRRLPSVLVEKLERSIPGPKELIWLGGDHIDRRPEAVREILAIVLRRMDENTAP